MIEGAGRRGTAGRGGCSGGLGLMSFLRIN